MTLLLDRDGLEARRRAVAGPLAPLARSLADDLERLLPSSDIFVPREKAKLTRAGGRCSRDGGWLEFDPRDRVRHRCPVCGSVYEDEVHYRWWIMGYQLWLSERAVHAAVLWVLTGTERHRELAIGILESLAERYLEYPNLDNVLGPTRPFFSTYLESIWLLQLAVALDLVEAGGGVETLGGRMRERLIEPSASLIASFNEGASNRQVWNSAALAAAGAMLENEAMVDAAIGGEGGLVAHLRNGILADGSWYEGENYHLFAHRGLWYLVTLAAARGVAPPRDLLGRFDDGFVTPFLTALPDFTFPARRDSQYGVSLRQWRTAESCELGVARRPDDARLTGALHELYREDISGGDSARWRSTAESERNVPGVRLSRADLGWKSLLFALPSLTTASRDTPRSTLLEGQGFAVIRRDSARTFIALDYGHTGGGHGHPDRLNLWLVPNERRILQDVGTGSYVERTLHWYRSTLAHNAPLVDGHSQRRVDGRLRAWDERGEIGWVDATADIATGVTLQRSVVAAARYVVDRVEWRADREITLDLPFHVEAIIDEARWTSGSLNGGSGIEDGFDFLTDAECAGPILNARLTADGVTGWVAPLTAHEWWRAVGPGPPGSPSRQFVLVRAAGRSGVIASVWSWGGDVAGMSPDGESLVVRLVNGDVHRHRLEGQTWRIEAHADGAVTTTLLEGARENQPREGQPTVEPERERPIEIMEIPRLPSPATVGDLTRLGAPRPLRLRLSRSHYRRSEDEWRQAGSPEALVSLGATPDELLVEVSVRKADPAFAPADRENPLDNEHPDVNSDGIQLHLSTPGGRSAWLVVPDAAAPALRITRREGNAATEPRGEWRRTPQGYQILLRVPRRALGSGNGPFLGLDVAVNEIGPGRERRRGQLALSARPGEWVYLRGDRSDPRHYRAFRFVDE